MGSVHLLRATIPHMLEQGGGAIVLTSSDASAVGEPERPAYAASKAGVIGLTQTLARVLAPWVRVNAVAPPRSNGSADPQPPLPVDGTVRAVLYLLASSHLNGEIVQVDEGS